jgi:hypothetical protein
LEWNIFPLSLRKYTQKSGNSRVQFPSCFWRPVPGRDLLVCFTKTPPRLFESTSIQGRMLLTDRTSPTLLLFRDEHVRREGICTAESGRGRGICFNWLHSQNWPSNNPPVQHLSEEALSPFHSVLNLIGT